MIIVENKTHNYSKTFTASSFWYDDVEGTLKIRGMIYDCSEAVEFRNVRVSIEDHWWGVKLEVYDKNSGVKHD